MLSRNGRLAADMMVQELTPWQDKVAVLTLAAGEKTTVHVLYVDAEYKDVIVDVLGSNRTYPGSDHLAFTIPAGKILSVSPGPAGLGPRRPLPPPDPCRARPAFSLPRFALFTTVFVIMIPVSFALFILLADSPYGIQVASIVCYTAAVILYTFSSNRGMQRYLFGCPFVSDSLPRLAVRHVGFLVVLFVLQTAALQLSPHLPAYWLAGKGRGMPPFPFALSVVCAGLALTQILTNRSFLGRAHLKHTPA